MKKKKWLSLDETAEIYKIPKFILLEMCVAGTIPCEKKNNKWRIDIGEVIRIAEVRAHVKDETRPRRKPNSSSLMEDGIYYNSDLYEREDNNDPTK